MASGQEKNEIEKKHAGADAAEQAVAALKRIGEVLVSGTREPFKAWLEETPWPQEGVPALAWSDVLRCLAICRLKGDLVQIGSFMPRALDCSPFLDSFGSHLIADAKNPYEKKHHVFDADSLRLGLDAERLRAAALMRRQSEARSDSAFAHAVVQAVVNAASQHADSPELIERLANLGDGDVAAKTEPADKRRILRAWLSEGLSFQSDGLSVPLRERRARSLTHLEASGWVEPGDYFDAAARCLELDRCDEQTAQACDILVEKVGVRGATPARWEKLAKLATRAAQEFDGEIEQVETTLQKITAIAEAAVLAREVAKTKKPSKKGKSDASAAQGAVDGQGASAARRKPRAL